MPKYGVHQIVLDKVYQKLNDQNHYLANIVRQNKKEAMLGAIGPDLFFWSPEYQAFDRLIGIYKAIKNFKESVDSIVAPFENAVDQVKGAMLKTMSDLGDKQTAAMIGLISQVKNTQQYVNNTLTTGALAGSLKGTNFLTDLSGLPNIVSEIFDLFVPDRQKNLTIDEWYWFDVLHYRKTGDFAEQLLKNALSSGSDKKLAYACGYLSHIATDLTGHPFVNQIVGGPYRLNVQRHATVENYIDGRIYNEIYNGASISSNLLDYLEFDSTISNEIVEQLNSTFKNTYPNEHPKYLSGNDIRESYNNLYTVLSIMQDSFLPRPEEPFDSIGRIISEALADLLEPPPSGPGSPSSICSFEEFFGDTDCFERFFDDLGEYFEHLGAILSWLGELIEGLTDLLATLVAAGFVSVILAVCYLIQLACYELYCIARESLVITGILYPEPENLNSNHEKNLTTTYLNCAFKRDQYPCAKKIGKSHLVCSSGELEKPATIPAFHVKAEGNLSPREFIEYEAFSLDNFKEYANASTISDTEALHRSEKSVGNAVDLSYWMITTANGNPDPSLFDIIFTNFDLDADRGYFFKTWEGRFDYSPTVSQNAKINYID